MPTTWSHRSRTSLSQPVTFSPYDDGCWKCEIPFIVGHFRAGVESDGPDPGLLQLLEGPGDVHDVGDRARG